MEFAVNFDSEELDLNKNVKIERSRERILSDGEIVKNEYLPELDTLIAQCEEKSIPVDYEKSDREMIRFYVSRIAEDIENDLDFRAEYILNSLTDMYNRSKASRRKVIRTRLKRHNFGIFRLVVFERRQPFGILRTKIYSKFYPF